MRTRNPAWASRDQKSKGAERSRGRLLDDDEKFQEIYRKYLWKVRLFNQFFNTFKNALLIFCQILCKYLMILLMRRFFGESPRMPCRIFTIFSSIFILPLDFFSSAEESEFYLNIFPRERMLAHQSAFKKIRCKRLLI